MDAHVPPPPKPPAGALDFDALFAPRSVCIVGASADRRRLNGRPLQYLTRHGFHGPIHLVNPRHDSIDGVPCFPSVDALPCAPDVALIMVRAGLVPDVLEQCGRIGTRAAIVFSAGFEEVAGEDALVDRVREAAARHGILLVGPNCEGVWSVGARAILTFGSAADRDELFHTPTAILSQSGSVGAAIVRRLQDSGFGCSYFVSVGNETVVSLLDYLADLIERDDVRTVLMFIEALKDGERLLPIARRAAERNVRLVALKSGNSRAGTAATASHTGKIATAHAIYRDLLAQAGVIEVETIAALVEAAEVLHTHPALLPERDTPSRGVAVFSIPGGTRGLTADYCDKASVPLTTFTDATVDRLKRLLPDFGVAMNPTDLTGQAVSDPELFVAALDVVASDPGNEALIVQLANRGSKDLESFRTAIRDAARRHGLPVVVSLLGDEIAAARRRDLAGEGLSVATLPDDAVRKLALLYKARGMARAKAVAEPARRMPERPLPRPDDLEAWSLSLAEAAIPVPDWRILHGSDGAASAADALGFPLAVKAMPSASDHKTEAGLVRLGIGSLAELRHAVAAIRHALKDDTAPVLVQAMCETGVEVVLAVNEDPDFGPILAIGAGGVLVELLADVRYLKPPFTRDAFDRLLGGMKIGRLLSGFRGAPAADVDALWHAASGLVALQQALRPRPAGIEINPLIVGRAGEGVRAADLLVKTAP